MYLECVAAAAAGTGMQIYSTVVLSTLKGSVTAQITCCCSKCNINIVIVATLGGSLSTVFRGEAKFSLFALVGILSTVGTAEPLFLGEGGRIL